MIGFVDVQSRAMINVLILGEPDEVPIGVDVWIDTAFNGCFFFSQQLIDELNLEQEAATDAVLADGSFVTLASYSRKNAAWAAYSSWPANPICNNGCPGSNPNTS